MSYIHRSCKKCVSYWPHKFPDGPLETCIQCRRFFKDYFRKKEAEQKT